MGAACVVVTEACVVLVMLGTACLVVVEVVGERRLVVTGVLVVVVVVAIGNLEQSAEPLRVKKIKY